MIRHVRNFFAWLAIQPGYKSKIQLHDVRYLQLSKNERKQATAPSEPKYPSLDEIKAMCSFSANTEIERRDRALIAFTALTGMRDQAIVTLRLGCYDPLDRVVKQLPSMGVKTKFRKEIFTTLLAIDDDLYRYFDEWYKYLKNDRHFADGDPLFPSTEIGLVGPDHHAYEAKGVSSEFWADAGPMRKIFRQRCKETHTQYYYPHSFRHFVTNLAERYISTPEQMKALSQNMGHEHITTTYRSYGAIGAGRANKVVRSIDFSKTNNDKQTQNFARQVAKEMFELQQK